MDDASVDGDLNVVDFRRGLTSEQREKLFAVDSVSSDIICSAQKNFRECKKGLAWGAIEVESPPDACTIYEHKDFGGMYQSDYIVI